MINVVVSGDNGSVTVIRMAINGYGNEQGFDLLIEPEGETFNLPPEREMVLEFRGTAVMEFEINHARDALAIWRSVGTQVWAGRRGEPLELIVR